MRSLVYYIGITIDGYIAGPDHETSFFPVTDELIAWIGREYPETVPTHARPHLGVTDAPNRRFDTVVMGRRTYEPGLAIGVTSPYAHLRQYVVSTTIGSIDDPAVELVAGDALGLVRGLKAEDGKLDIWLCGGGTLAGELLPEIDELIVKSYPVAAGDGIPAFTGGFRRTAFTPTRREGFDDGTLITWSTRAR